MTLLGWTTKASCAAAPGVTVTVAVWVIAVVTPPTVTVAETVLRLTKQRPALGSWDWIFDIREPHEKATADELDQIARAFNAAWSKQSYTIFVSDDPATYDRCAVMALKFLDRRHLVAKTMAEAKALLPWTMPSI